MVVSIFTRSRKKERAPFLVCHFVTLRQGFLFHFCKKTIVPFLSAASENGIFGSYGMSKLCIDGIFHFCFIHFKSVQKCSIIIFECFRKMNPALCINLIEFATHVPGGMCFATVGYSVWYLVHFIEFMKGCCQKYIST